MTAEEIQKALAEPFGRDEVKAKPGKVSGNRALALYYIDARCVMDRLDTVFTVAGWMDEYTVLAGGEVKCRLSVLIDGNWVSKEDVGGESEQPDEGDRVKAAFSDALKRAAVKLGVGRYLYGLKSQWVDYDPVKKQLILNGKPAAQAPQQPQQAQRQTKVETGAFDGIVHQWKGKVAACGTNVNMLNQFLSELPNIDSAAKKPVWHAIREAARAKGWEWSESQRQFLEVQRNSA
jgi:hypothetical protein